MTKNKFLGSPLTEAEISDSEESLEAKVMSGSEERIVRARACSTPVEEEIPAPIGRFNKLIGPALMLGGGVMNFAPQIFYSTASIFGGFGLTMALTWTQPVGAFIGLVGFFKTIQDAPLHKILGAKPMMLTAATWFGGHASLDYFNGVYTSQEININRLQYQVDGNNNIASQRFNSITEIGSNMINTVANFIFPSTKDKNKPITGVDFIKSVFTFAMLCGVFACSMILYKPKSRSQESKVLTIKNDSDTNILPEPRTNPQLPMAPHARGINSPSLPQPSKIDFVRRALNSSSRQEPEVQ